jgi:hypothetical protein
MKVKNKMIGPNPGTYNPYFPQDKRPQTDTKKVIANLENFFGNKTYLIGESQDFPEKKISFPDNPDETSIALWMEDLYGNRQKLSDYAFKEISDGIEKAYPSLHDKNDGINLIEFKKHALNFMKSNQDIDINAVEEYESEPDFDINALNESKSESELNFDINEYDDDDVDVKNNGSEIKVTLPKKKEWDPNESITIDLKSDDIRKNGEVVKLVDLHSFTEFDLKKTQGRFKFVINTDNSIYIGYDNGDISHNALASSEKSAVKGAGIILFDGEKILSVSNYSGHYKPAPVNAYYSFRKIAKKLNLDCEQYNVLVGLQHRQSRTDGFTCPVLVVTHDSLQPKLIKYHSEMHSLLYIDKNTILFNKYKFPDFSTDSSKMWKPYIDKFNGWELRGDKIYDNTDSHPKVNKGHPLYEFISLLGFEAERIIKEMPQGRELY